MAAQGCTLSVHCQLIQITFLTFSKLQNKTDFLHAVSFNETAQIIGVKIYKVHDKCLLVDMCHKVCGLTSSENAQYYFVGLPRTVCAYFVCVRKVFSVYYTQHLY